MAAALGAPFSDKGVRRELTAEDFRGNAKQVTESCLLAQKSFRERSEEKRKLEKYRKMLGLASLRPLGEPQFLIPPYFQFDAVGDEWYDLTARCIRASNDFRDGIPLRPVLHFSRWTAIENPAPAIEVLDAQDVGEVFLYCNNCKELEVDESVLAAYRAGVEAFSEAGIRPYALHGGYFAVMMSKFGLGGFADGVGYGEWRDSGYHRGGQASIRLYVLRLHRYVTPAEAQALVDEDPDFFAADTELFSEYLESETPLDEVSLPEAHDHLMKCRAAEVDVVREHSVAEIAADLRESRTHLREASPLLFREFGPPLRHWRNAILAGAEEDDDD
jgi:hypothetical protein